MPNPTDEAQELFDRACNGDQAALGRLFAQNRERLHLMVRLRLDRRLAGRIDPSDVLQEAFLEATERFGEYQNKPSLPSSPWLRLAAPQRLLILHRHHLNAQMRTADREHGFNLVGPEATSAALAEHLLQCSGTPSQAAARGET